MSKQTWQPGTMLSPLPPALIGSGNMEHPNVMTAAWTGIICSDPVLTYVSLRPSRYTHELISQNKEFTINLPTWKIAEATDTVGVKSGRDLDKFALTGLTAEPCSKVKAPQIAECPVSMECKVLEVRPFGTHDMFLAEVVAVNVDDKYIDENDALDLEKAGLLAYAHGFYYTLGRKIGKFGFSVEKKKNPAAPSIATVMKADEKFGKKKIQMPKGRTVSEAKDTTTFFENGVEVIVKKPKFSPKHKPTSLKNDKERKDFARQKSVKFSRKENKGTNYEPYSFKKKSDGSFKQKPKRK